MMPKRLYTFLGGATLPVALMLTACNNAPADTTTTAKTNTKSNTEIAQSVPLLSVDATADRHPIAPEIYGLEDSSNGMSTALMTELSLPILRWGGDATTRYNWEIDSTNSGDDFYFNAGGNPNPTPGASSDKFVTRIHATGKALLTIPIIPYINKATASDASFPVSIFGAQQKVNPYVHPVVNGKATDAGNGRTPDGKPISLTKEQILRIHQTNTPAHQAAWVRHLVERFGTAAKGGVEMYELDNEPGGWGNTHRDVHPGETGHDELVNLSIAYAAAVKAADPTAKIVGPGDFLMHYQNDGKPGDGKKEHNGLGQADYYLQKMHAYEKEHGVRLLDYFDEHFYPTAQDGQNDAIELESTRSLWDPTYIEKNWIGKYIGAIALIPHFREWANKQYPGTKISISEYGWGAPDKFLGALEQADILGIFGRERLDMACRFGGLKPEDPIAYAFRLYRNYDGQGGRYGDTWVRSQSTDQVRLAVYSAERTKDHALTIMVINKSEGDLKTSLTLSHFTPGTRASVYRYSNANLKAIVPQPAQPLTPTGFTATYPARSITLFVVPRTASTRLKNIAVKKAAVKKTYAK